MNKQQEIGKLEQAWASFKASFDGLTDEQMMEPGVTGSWSRFLRRLRMDTYSHYPDHTLAIHTWRERKA